MMSSMSVAGTRETDPADAVGLSMQAGRRHVIAIADASLSGVGCDHAMAGIIKQQSGQ
jgi:hypothetical protein